MFAIKVWWINLNAGNVSWNEELAWWIREKSVHKASLEIVKHVEKKSFLSSRKVLSRCKFAFFYLLHLRQRVFRDNLCKTEKFGIQFEILFKLLQASLMLNICSEKVYLLWHFYKWETLKVRVLESFYGFFSSFSSKHIENLPETLRKTCVERKFPEKQNFCKQMEKFLLFNKELQTNFIRNVNQNWNL